MGVVNGSNISIEELDPVFVGIWKGTRGAQADADTYHSHDFFEVAYITAGAGRYHIEGALYDVKEGDLLILNPGVRHQALPGEDRDNPTTEFFVGFSNLKFPGFPDNFFPTPGNEYIIHVKEELKQKIVKLCAAMEDEQKDYREGRYFMMKSYVMQLVVLLIREQCSSPLKEREGYAYAPVNKKYVVERIVDYFEEYYNQKITLDHLAEKMYLSPFYISKIFKSEMGETPINYLITIRMEKAKILLEKGEVTSIQEVAAMVGYDDAYHFSKLFKKRYGIAPSKVREH